MSTGQSQGNRNQKEGEERKVPDQGIPKSELVPLSGLNSSVRTITIEVKYLRF